MNTILLLAVCIFATLVLGQDFSISKLSVNIRPVAPKTCIVEFAEKYQFEFLNTATTIAITLPLQAKILPTQFSIIIANTSLASANATYTDSQVTLQVDPMGSTSVSISIKYNTSNLFQIDAESLLALPYKWQTENATLVIQQALIKFDISGDTTINNAKAACAQVNGTALQVQLQQVSSIACAVQFKSVARTCPQPWFLGTSFGTGVIIISCVAMALLISMVVALILEFVRMARNSLQHKQ